MLSYQDGEYKYQTSSAIDGAIDVSYKYSELMGTGGFIARYSTTKFKESLGEYEYNTGTGTTTKKKRVIIYTEI